MTTRHAHLLAQLRLRSATLAALLALAACTDPYAHSSPPDAQPPAGLDPPTWSAHLEEDLLPYWTMDAAKGTPLGNFPTYRGMDGSVQGSTDRKPRMLGRQVFTYCIAFLMTGDEQYLDLARAGTRWLLDHARDANRGGWYADLDAAGNPVGTGAKWAQDTAYAAMGPAAFFYVTRDPEAEAAVLATRDLLFDPATYWDAANGRIRDGMTFDLSAEAYLRGAGSWELVAQLDPVTAFLLLVQPVLSEPARRDQALGDLRTLALLIRASFWKDGFVWGTTGGLGSFGGWHSDFGHMLKAQWALLQIDKRLPDHPLREFVAENAPANLTLAHDASYGRWAKNPTSATTVRYGSDWWAYAESDQLAATLALHDPAWIPIVAETSRHFREDYVDRTRAAREVVPSIDRSGNWVWGWTNSDTAKCNEWKNGFHAAEHALVMWLFSSWLADADAPLYFAFPAERIQELAAVSRPYTLDGRVAAIEDLGPLAGDPSRHKVRVRFDQLR